MHTRSFLLLLLALTASVGKVSAQYVDPPSRMADDLCACMGTIDPTSDVRTFDLAVRHCLNSTIVQHSGEVIELMRRFPAQDRKFYLLGYLIGGSLDRSCPQYPLVKDRLRLMFHRDPETGAST